MKGLGDILAQKSDSIPTQYPTDVASVHQPN
jgi:hypothetical protein